MHHAIFLPAFDALADPRTLVDIAQRAEANGWDGLFLWDHLTYAAPVEQVADAWMVLAAVALATERIRIGTMVTPLPRRRPQVVARQVATLDHLSGGRAVLGIGVGDEDAAGDFDAFHDERDATTRGEMLAEGVAVMRALWSGERVTIHGEYHGVDGAQFLPRPVQDPHPPVWGTARPGDGSDLHGVANLDGIFPVGYDDPAQLRELVDELAGLRHETDRPFDVCVNLLSGTDPDAWEAAGATWLATHVGPFRLDADDVRRMADSPPPAWSRVDGWG